MLKYKERTEIDVFIDSSRGKGRIGVIHRIDGLWQYWPQNKKKLAGGFYSSINLLKKDLEAP